MQDDPDARSLVSSVQQFLESEVLPVTTDQRLRFRVRIAANVLAIVERELELGRELEDAELRRLRALMGKAGGMSIGDEKSQLLELNEELARRILDKEIEAQPGSAVWQHLRRTVVEALTVANPGYLQRIGET